MTAKLGMCNRYLSIKLKLWTRTDVGQNQGYTVRKGQCNFKLRKHGTYHMMGISTLSNVKMCDISANVE
jgi:hypothetical protein